MCGCTGSPSPDRIAIITVEGRTMMRLAYMAAVVGAATANGSVNG
jgi:hypothetical protein